MLAITVCETNHRYIGAHDTATANWIGKIVLKTGEEHEVATIKIQKVPAESPECSCAICMATRRYRHHRYPTPINPLNNEKHMEIVG